MSKSEAEQILKAKDNLPEVTPTPPEMEKPKSSPQALKERLEWGEPGFTVLDVRDREAFNKSRIMGAMPFPLNDEAVAERTIGTLEPNREIYVYGDSDEEASRGAAKLREHGFTEVAELQGGLSAWKNIGAPTEGTEEQGEKVAGHGAYTIQGRLEENENIQQKF
jgi:rhodanese-related sulfurtransferase